MKPKKMSDEKKKKKGILIRFFDWIAKGARQAEKRGQGPGHC